MKLIPRGLVDVQEHRNINSALTRLGFAAQWAQKVNKIRLRGSRVVHLCNAIKRDGRWLMCLKGCKPLRFYMVTKESFTEISLPIIEGTLKCLAERMEVPPIETRKQKFVKKLVSHLAFVYRHQKKLTDTIICHRLL